MVRTVESLGVIRPLGGLVDVATQHIYARIAMSSMYALLKLFTSEDDAE
jgi:hypothetical protein